MSRWRRLRCRSTIHFLEIKSEIKSERLREREKKSEIPLCSCARCGDNDMMSLLRRRWWRRDRLWVTTFGFGLCIGDFFFLINTSMLCVWFAFVLGNGVWSLYQRRRDVMGFARRQQRDGFDFYSLYFFFFLIENPWACRERATCNGLAVGFACRGLLGLDRLVLFYIYIYIYIFFFQILVQNFFGGFIFWLESRTDYR